MNRNQSSRLSEECAKDVVQTMGWEKAFLLSSCLLFFSLSVQWKAQTLAIHL